MKENDKYKENLVCELGTDCFSIKRRLYDILVPSTNSFIRCLRKLEHLKNRQENGKFINRIVLYFVEIRFKRLSCITGISIPPNTCSKGLTLYHHGSIVVNDGARIGENCCIMNNVNIGANGGSSEAPQIGRDVYIGPGAVLYGNITIADGCYIGANAVVFRSFDAPNTVIVGSPAIAKKTDSICWWKKNGLNR